MSPAPASFPAQPFSSESLPKKVRIVEVGPRDGLQNQSKQVPTDIKLEWIHRLSESGLAEIEVTSFVHPKWIPQLADAHELLSRLPASSPTLYSALVPNLKGLQAAQSLGLQRIAFFTAASEAFNQKNINATIDESFLRFDEMLAAMPEKKPRIRGYLSTCFGCPYGGEVSVQKVVEVSTRLLDIGCEEIVLSDTIGKATPQQVVDVVSAVAENICKEKITLHMHDTRGTALANILTGLLCGITSFDAASGGLGGCPYAPGAAGNLATEDLVFMLDGMGIETGIDLQKLLAANLWFEQQLDQGLPSRMLASARGQA